MISAIKKSMSVSQEVLRALLSAESPSDQPVSMTLSPEETYPSIKTLPNIAVIDVIRVKSTTVTFVNSLTFRRVMLVSVLVNSPAIRVSFVG